jgi:uncharacterized repeat protein (TIGR01451 family)
VVVGAQAPVVTLEKKGPATLSQGQLLVYEIIVRNVGAMAAQQVRIEDELPAGTRFVTAEPAPSVQPDRLSWVLDSVPPGGERHMKVAVQPSSDGDWTSNATVIVSTSSSLRTHVTRSNLTMTLTGPETVPMGQTAAFQIRVTNNGNQPLTGLVLRDKLPAGLQHPAGAELEADLGTLEPGKTKNVDLTARAVQPGRFTNEAVVTTPDGQQAQAQATVQVIEASHPPH